MQSLLWVNCMRHLQVVDRVLYSKPLHRRLLLRGGNQTTEGYTDANHVDYQDLQWCKLSRLSRSTSGFCTFLCGKYVSWRSKKQSLIARLSVAVKFRAMAQRIELLWMNILLDDFKTKYEGHETVLQQ